jgi:WD40 repeat protein
VQKITNFRVKRYLYGIDSLAVHPTEPFVLSSCGGYIQLWDWDKNWECIQTFEKQGYLTFELELAFNPKDTNEFASASTDLTVKVWSPHFFNLNFGAMMLCLFLMDVDPISYTWCSAMES